MTKQRERVLVASAEPFQWIADGLADGAITEAATTVEDSAALISKARAEMEDALAQWRSERLRKPMPPLFRLVIVQDAELMEATHKDVSRLARVGRNAGVRLTVLVDVETPPTLTQFGGDLTLRHMLFTASHVDIEPVDMRAIAFDRYSTAGA